MTTTISTQETTEFQLNAADSPLIITATGGVSVASAYAIDGTAFTPFIVSNAGTIMSGGGGVYMLDGGTVSNTGSVIGISGTGIRFIEGGTISNGGSLGGKFGAVILEGSGLVSNTGEIDASQIGLVLGAGGTVSNSGVISGEEGVYLGAAGTVSNTGFITASSGDAVNLSGGGTLLNAGTIAGGPGSGGAITAVQFAGSQSNRLIIDPGAVFNGTVSGSTGVNILELAGSGDGTITSTLASQYAGFNQVTVDAGADWTLTQDIGTGITITNAGDLYLAGASMTNAGVIDSGAAGSLSVSAATLVNTGTIIATLGYAADLSVDLLSNSGTIVGADGIQMSDIESVNIKNGFPVAVYASSTLVNSGTITGGNGSAVKFSGPASNRLVIDPGAVFNGTVSGGSGVNTLELAGPRIVYRNSYSYYYNTGSLTNTLASQYAGFTQVTVDAGADWRLTQDIAAGITITNAGYLFLVASSLTNAGVILSSVADGLKFTGGTFSNTGTIINSTGSAIYLEGGGTIINSGAMTGGPSEAVHVDNINNAAVINSGTMTGATGILIDNLPHYLRSSQTSVSPAEASPTLYATVVNSGTITGTGGTAVQFTGSGDDRLVIDPGAVFNGIVSGGTGVNILELAGSGYGTITNTLANQYAGFTQVTVDAGADWTLTQNISAGITITNAGDLYLAAPSLTNAGVILSGNNSLLQFTGGTLANTGTLYATGYGYGVELDVGATLINSGAITSAQGDGVYVFYSGLVYNSGSIGGATGVEIKTRTAIVNPITGPFPRALSQDESQTAATLVNGGTITGTGGTAVQFTGPGDDRLVIDPGAVFNGTVSGGSGVNTLELAGPRTVYRNSYSYYYDIGHLTNTLASQYVGFTQVTVDAGADWRLTQDIAAGITITNAGYLFLTASSLTNAGVILSRVADGLKFTGGTFSNTGTIINSAGSAIYLPGGGTIINSGAMTGGQSEAVYVNNINNAAVINSGTMTGATGVLIYNDLLTRITIGFPKASPEESSPTLYATVVNSGTITGTGGTAVRFIGPGDDRLVVDPGAVFNGTIAGGSGVNILELAGSGYGTITGTLANQYAGFTQVTVDAGANWTLTQDIGAGISITNSGYLYLAASSLTNAGVIVSSVADGLQFTGGTFSNTGTIINSTGNAIYLPGGGTIINSGAMTGGPSEAVYVKNNYNAAVINSGTMTGATGVFIFNFFSRSTPIGFPKVSPAEASPTLYATVVNSGTITGTGGAAVQFIGPGDDRLVIDPGAVFNGTVSGGSGVNILELASGATSGYLANTLASQYLGFTQVTVDAGADWTLTQDIGAGITITNAGDLYLAGAGMTNAGVIDSGAAGSLSVSAATLVNTGAIIATLGYAADLSVDLLSNSGTIAGADGIQMSDIESFDVKNGFPVAVYASSTLVNSGTITGGNGSAVKFSGPASNRLVVDPGAVFNGTIAGGTGVNILELAGPSTVYRNGSSYYYRSGYLTNTLASQYVGFTQVTVDAGADWSLERDIGAGITITNAGTLGLYPANFTFTNAGMIASGATGALFADDSVVNTGAITGTQGYALYVTDGGVLVNTGSIGGADGVKIGGVKSFDPKPPFTRSDLGGTLINSGTITGTSGIAVDFNSQSDRLVIDPGAVFNGIVSGGTGVNIMELAAAGADIGTVSNIGVQYTNFGYVTIDSGAEWQINGAIGSGVTVINHGALLAASSSLSTGTAASGLAATGAIIANASLISGGDAYGLSGVAGIGVALTGGSASNTGNIYGGYAYGREGAGGAGVVLDGGTLTNAGRITGGKLDVQSGNAPGAAGAGVLLQSGTLMTAGTITGGIKTSTSAQADAVQFAGAATLIVETGAVFNGDVAASSSGDVLEVSGTSAAALTGIGTEFTGFAQISFAAGAAWTLAGNTLGLASGETISGFTFGDALDLTGVTANSFSFTDGALTLSTGGAPEIIDFAGSLASDHFSISSDNSGGTLIEEVTCFCAGTRIATARGDVPVEDLVIGDLVRTLHAGLQPVRWIGTRSYAAPFCNHAKVLPIRIGADAIAPGMPARDLLVSPGHAMFVGGTLIHASLLVNGGNITQLTHADGVTYYHIELATHEIILAENCPAETFMGEYFRQQFQNAESFSRLYPGARAPERPAVPILGEGPQRAAMLRRLRARIGAAGDVGRKQAALF